MGIHQSTRIQAYQLNKGGARARLAILRMIAAESVNNRNPHTRLSPDDWRGARDYTLKGYAAAFSRELCQGLQNDAPVWYSHGSEQFRDERHSDEVLETREMGYYTDADCDETARGIVGRLTHGRFIAGYEWSSNGERVYFGEVFDCERDAARMADEHARVFAESARDDSERFNAMQDAENELEEARDAFAYAWAARHVSFRHRQTARESIEALRAAVDTLAEKTAEYEDA